MHPCPLPPGPPSHLPPHPTLQPVTEPLFEFAESYSKFPLTICFTYGITNLYITLNPQGQRSLAADSPWGRKESIMTKHTAHIHTEVNNEISELF